MNDKETAKFYEVRNETTSICGAGDKNITSEILTKSDPLAIARQVYIGVCRAYNVNPNVYFAGEKVMDDFKRDNENDGQF